MWTSDIEGKLHQVLLTWDVDFFSFAEAHVSSG